VPLAIPPGDVIDLTALPFASIGSAVLLPGNVLQIVEDSQSYTLQFDSNITGGTFKLASDSVNGTDVVLAQLPVFSRQTPFFSRT
jgi:hypothetical protein